jgi:hypothetical protein
MMTGKDSQFAPLKAHAARLSRDMKMRRRAADARGLKASAWLDAEKHTLTRKFSLQRTPRHQI